MHVGYHTDQPHKTTPQSNIKRQRLVCGIRLQAPAALGRRLVPVPGPDGQPPTMWLVGYYSNGTPIIKRW